MLRNKSEQHSMDICEPDIDIYTYIYIYIYIDIDIGPALLEYCHFPSRDVSSLKSGMLS